MVQQQRDDVIRQLIVIAGGNEVTGLAVHDRFSRAADVRRDYRPSGSHVLEDRV